MARKKRAGRSPRRFARLAIPPSNRKGCEETTMLDKAASNFNRSNGISHTNQPYSPCRSDYEERPEVPAPQPKWAAQFPKFTHNVAWQGSDGMSHSLTLRTDDVHELFGILKGLKHVIRASKKAAEQQPHASQNTDPQVPHSDTPDKIHCHIHGVDMPRRWSKRTNGHDFGHKLPDGAFCYGRAKA